MKNIKSLSLVCFLFVTLLQIDIFSFEGFSERYEQANLSQLIQEEDTQDVDTSIIKVVDELGGGVYDYEVEAVIPFFPSQIRREWKRYKNEIAERIGPVYPLPTVQSNLWENSAKTIDDLLKDARLTAPYFKEKCVQIAKKTDAVAYFGAGDESIVKSRASLTRKVKRISQELGVSEEQAVSRVRDALRGTIAVDTPEQISLVVDAIKEFAQSEKREVVFINIWEENRLTGYIGVHAKLLLPVYEKQMCIQKNIIVEIQIHLKCVMESTRSSVKEGGHFLYEHVRDGEPDAELQASASTLMYLAALKQCPKSVLPRYIALHSRKR